ncbi:MAG: class I SAM-dependent methyltransferase, partial [Pirellulales bacterium]|nr:class I SAM-dependent methyltransferase [Pirellulales bacterium]
MNLISIAESGMVPDALTRIGIRQLLKRRQREQDDSLPVDDFADELRRSPLAVSTDSANEQHYEVPAEFFQHVLGPRLKYSACYFERPTSTLAEAEEAMLRMTCERAEIGDGMRVLELGCGWGSLTLWIAEQYPGTEITAVSNSHGQCEFIQRRASERGLRNVTVVTADMRNFNASERFDRVVSVEMFEHMRNYELLLHRVARWLRRDGIAFVHIF